MRAQALDVVEERAENKLEAVRFCMYACCEILLQVHYPLGSEYRQRLLEAGAVDENGRLADMKDLPLEGILSLWVR
jgi:hypothetical protein